MTRRRAAADVLSLSTVWLALLGGFSHWLGRSFYLWTVLPAATCALLDVADARFYEGRWLAEAPIVRNGNRWTWRAAIQILTLRDLLVTATCLAIATEALVDWADARRGGAELVITALALITTAFHVTWFGRGHHEVILDDAALQVLRGGEQRSGKNKKFRLDRAAIDAVLLDTRSEQLELSVNAKGAGAFHLVYGSKERVPDDDVRELAHTLAVTLNVPLHVGRGNIESR